MVLRVGDAPELRAAVLALKGLDRDLRSRINKATTSTMNPVWKSLVEANATGHQDFRIMVPGTRIAAGNPPSAVAANSKRALRKGKGALTPAFHWRGFEFGAVDRNAYSRYKRTSPGGKVHQVERRTMRGMPRRTPKGRVVYPAFAEIAPRMVSLWVQLIVKTVAEAAEGKR